MAEKRNGRLSLSLSVLAKEYGTLSEKLNIGGNVTHTSRAHAPTLRHTYSHTHTHQDITSWQTNKQ